MKQRKELFTAMKNALSGIPELEFIDLHRNQFDFPGAALPAYRTACLIKAPQISWEIMTGRHMEGNASIDVFLYCKDDWMNPQDGGAGTGSTLIEIDLIDKICSTLSFLYGEYFKPLQQSSEEQQDARIENFVVYKISFTTRLYKQWGIN